MERRLDLLALLLRAHGGLLLAYAAFAVFGGLVMLLAGLVPEVRREIPLPAPVWFAGAGMYALLAMWNTLLGVLCLIGGRAHARRSSQTLAVGGILAGVGTAFGAFTLPLALVIGVLGLLAHLDPAAAEAFGGSVMGPDRAGDG